MSKRQAAFFCTVMGVICMIAWIISDDTVMVVVSGLMFSLAAWQLRLARR